MYLSVILPVFLYFSDFQSRGSFKLIFKRTATSNEFDMKIVLLPKGKPIPLPPIRVCK